MNLKYSQLLIIQNYHWLENPGKSKIPVRTKGTEITVMKRKKKLFISLIHYFNIIFNYLWSVFW